MSLSMVVAIYHQSKCSHALLFLLVSSTEILSCPICTDLGIGIPTMLAIGLMFLFVLYKLKYSTSGTIAITRPMQ